MRQGGGDIVAALSSSRDLPAEALERAVRSPARLAEAVLPLLEAAASGPAPSERDANLLFWGVHALAAVREQRLCAPLLRALRRPDGITGEWIGDAVGGTLPRVVVSVFDGDVRALEAAIFDRDTDEFLRWSLFGAYAFLTHAGRIPRAEAEAFLLRFEAERPARAGDAAWTGWEETVALLGLADLADRVAAARADARLLQDVSDPDWFALTLKEAVERPEDNARFADRDLGYVEDVVAELEAALADDEEEGEPEEPHRNPLREVGRNDLCPCGSGRKFKRCCLTA
ncbi:MAG: motif domain protein [Enterovirga sp.]|nr:motif domain protein [Enterovirga sp.]